MEKQIKKPNPVFEEARACIEKLEAQEHAHTSTQAFFAKAEAKVVQARRVFGSASAMVLTKSPNGHLPAGLPAQRKLDEAQSELTQAELTVLGSRRNASRLYPEAFSTRERLRAELPQYRTRATQKFLKRHAPVIEAYREFLREGHALADALGLKLIHNPENPEPLMTALLDLPDCGSWQEDEEAKALHAENCDPWKWLQKLERMTADAEQQALRPDLYPPEDAPIDRTRYVVHRPFKLNGKEFQRGDRLSAFNIPGGAVGMLQKLKRADQIRPILE